MQYQIVFVENGSSNSFKMRQNLAKIQVVYPHMKVCTTMYHHECPFASFVDAKELPITLLFYNKQVVCRMKGMPSYEFMKLWIEEKILENGGTLEELS